MSGNNGKNKIGNIHLTDGAMERLLNERNQAAQQHLEEMNKQLAVEGSAINAVFLAAIQHGGLPAAGSEESFFQQCKAVAKTVSDDQLLTRATKVKALLKDLNIHQAPAAIEWSCKQVGVTLFDAPPTEKPLVEAH